MWALCAPPRGITRTQNPGANRVNTEQQKIGPIDSVKILGVCISDDLSWTKNTQEIIKKAYSRLSLLTKLKYVGVSKDDLLEIYILFIRSVLEYCCVAFHSSLTVEQSKALETVQKVCLKVILGQEYDGYDNALKLTGLKTLNQRREDRCLSFSIKSLKHPVHKRLFPVNPRFRENPDYLREREPFVVNFAKTSSYKNSTIPYCQNLLNTHFAKKATK